MNNMRVDANIEATANPPGGDAEATVEADAEHGEAIVGGWIQRSGRLQVRPGRPQARARDGEDLKESVKLFQ